MLELLWRPAEEGLTVTLTVTPTPTLTLTPTLTPTLTLTLALPLTRPAEELLCCHCAPAAPGGESLLYVWQLSSGRLERVLRGAEAAPHLAAMARAPLCQTVPETTPP